MVEKKISKPAGGHTPVSNQFEELGGAKKAACRAVKAVSQEPSEGKAGELTRQIQMGQRQFQVTRKLCWRWNRCLLHQTPRD